MKKILLFILFASLTVSAQQALRYDNFAATTASASGIGNLLQAIPNATITVFNAPGVGVNCAGGGCVAATTYTSNTGQTACGGGLPVTRPTGNICLSTADSQGNFGFWAASGAYQYCIAATNFTTQCTNIVLGAVSTYLSNNVRYVDGVKYPQTGPGVASAIADQITAGGGIVDARGVLSATFASELDIGNNSGVPIALLVPCTVSNTQQSNIWLSTVSDGVSVGFKLFSKSSIIGCYSGAGNAFSLWGKSTFNGAAVFQANGNYPYGKGFGIGLDLGGKVVNAIAEFTGLADNAAFENMTVFNNQGLLANVPRVGWVHNSCCDAYFRTISFEGQNGASTASSIPLQVGSLSDGTSNMIFDGINAVHPGNSEPAVLVTGSSTYNIKFSKSIYMEILGSEETDTTTAAFQCNQNAGPVLIDSLYLFDTVTSATRYPIDTGSGTACKATVVGQISNQHATNTNCINDHNQGVTITGCSNTGFTSYRPVFNLISQWESTAGPSISSGFNTGSMGQSNGTAFFVVNVGTGAAGSTGTLAMPTIPSPGHAWICSAQNLTRADQIQQSGAPSASAVTVTNYGTTFVATNWTNSDTLLFQCGGY